MGTTYNTLAQIIADFENVGAKWGNDVGGIEDAQGNPVSFSSPQEGINAIEQQLEYDASGASSIYNPNMTLSDYETAYTGGNTQAGNTVAQMLGVSPSTTLAQLSDQNLGLTAPSIGGQPGLIIPGSDSSVDTNPTTGDVTVTTPSGTKTQNVDQSWLGFLADGPSNVVAILIGLILIAGAVFSFSQVKDTAVSAGGASFRGIRRLARSTGEGAALA